jgi:hypothetical protein
MFFLRKIYMGDFNARVGQKSPQSSIKPFGLFKYRSKDQVCNTRGRQLMDFMQGQQLLMVNGSTPHDYPAQFTFYRGQSKTVIDYCLMSEDIISTL